MNLVDPRKVAPTPALAAVGPGQADMTLRRPPHSSRERQVRPCPPRYDLGVPNDLDILGDRLRELRRIGWLGKKGTPSATLP